MAIKDHEGIEQLIKILGRINLQKGTAVLDKTLVIRQNITRPVRRAAFKQVVDRAGAEIVARALGDIEHVESVFGAFGQLHQLLLMG